LLVVVDLEQQPVEVVHQEEQVEEVLE